MRKGFTLAEVLITLGIIGVVAALTIPILVNSYQKQEYVTGLKKAYTEFNQALIQMAADQGCPGDLKCTGLFAADKTNQDLGTELVKYFKVIKNCESSDAGGPVINGCMPENYSQSIDGSGRYDYGEYAPYYRFITADGISFAIGSFKGDCDMLLGNGNVSQVCAQMEIDINGPTKGPNTTGRDMFTFNVTNGKGPLLYPPYGKDDTEDGYYKDQEGCSKTSPGGIFCPARILEDGWRMNY